MILTILRGTNKIGGSCTELRCLQTRIILDIGMPLKDYSGEKFDIKKYRGLKDRQLVEAGMLPDVIGLYKWDKGEAKVDAVLISHPHLDHYGFWEYVDPSIPIYMGERAQKIIELEIMAPSGRKNVARAINYKTGKTFKIGPFSVNPYLVDHAAYDSHALVVQAEGKTVIYSGDLRMHGHIPQATKHFLAHAPKGADVLLLEGTMMGARSDERCRSEKELEAEFEAVIRKAPSIVLVYCSVQNIDRIASIYRAAKRAGRTVVTDIYGAEVFNAVWKLEGQKDMANIVKAMRIFYPYRLANMLGKKNPSLLWKYAEYQIKKPDIKERKNELVMLVRPGMVDDLTIIGGMEKTDFIYSQWAGYKAEPDTARLLDFASKKGMTFHEIHTSGHAVRRTLRKIVDALKPRAVIPIHTENPAGYDEFVVPVRRLKDGQEIEV